CYSTFVCLIIVTIFFLSSCSFHCQSVNFICACRISFRRYLFCSSLSPIASWFWITSSGAKKLRPTGSGPGCGTGGGAGCCPRTRPAARNSRAHAKQIFVFISFLLARLDCNSDVRLLQFRRTSQNLLPRLLQRRVLR